jgi:hypothetical protein
VIDQDERAEGFKLLARQAWQSYQSKIPVERIAIKLPPFKDIDKVVLDRILNPTNGLPPEAQAVLRTKLGIDGEKSATNSVTPQTAPTDKKVP